MRAGKQLFLVGIALLVLSQAAAARPWLSRTSLADSNLSSLQEQLRQNQLRRLTTLDDESEYEEMTMQLFASDSASNSNSLGYGYGYGYGSYGYGYGDSLQEPAASATPRALLAPEVSYSTDDVVQAGAAWDPSAATIELQESGQRQQQFYEEGDEIMVGPVPAVREAGQRASQFYEEGDEVFRGPAPTRP